MRLLISMLERISWCICRHEWVRDRDSHGNLMLRCLRCGKSKEHTLATLIRWRPDYHPIAPSHITELADPVPQALDSALKRKQGSVPGRRVA